MPGERRQRDEEEEEEREREEQAEAAGQSISSGSVRHRAAGAPLALLLPRAARSRGPRAQDCKCSAGGRGYHRGSGKNRARGCCPQLRRQPLPRASPGRHGLCPFSPGRRKVDGDRRHWVPGPKSWLGQGGGGRVQLAPARLVSQEAPQSAWVPREPRGAAPPPRTGAGARAATE